MSLSWGSVWSCRTSYASRLLRPLSCKKLRVGKTFLGGLGPAFQIMPFAINYARKIFLVDFHCMQAIFSVILSLECGKLK